MKSEATAPGQKAAHRSLAGIVSRNSFWYSIELFFEIVVGFSTSIAMARLIGPTALGYFNLVMWLINMSGVFGNLGVPLAARKFMAEFMGRGQLGLARAVYERAQRIQMMTAGVITVAGLGVVAVAVDPDYRLMSMFMMLSLFPNMVLAVPSQANLAREDTRANVWGSLVGQSLYVVFVVASLLTGWDLLGVAIGIFVYRTVEMLVRLLPVKAWMSELPEEPLGEDIARQLRNYSGQGMILMAVHILVWNRSDMIFLKWLTSDTAQISFYAAAFNLTERALTLPRIFSTASGATLMVQYGRDESRLRPMLDVSSRYLLLCSVPVLWGLGALSPSLIPLLYGPLYVPAIPVLSLAAAFGIAAALAPVASATLQSYSKMGTLIGWTCVAAATDIAVNLVLIPRYGAWGAALANGAGQMVGAIGLWWAVGRLCQLRPAWGTLAKIILCGAGEVAVLVPLNGWLPPWQAVTVGAVLGSVVYVVLLRVLRVLGPDDGERLARACGKLPERGKRPALSLIHWLAGAGEKA